MQQHIYSFTKTFGFLNLSLTFLTLPFFCRGAEFETINQLTSWPRPYPAYIAGNEDKILQYKHKIACNGKSFLVAWHEEWLYADGWPEYPAYVTRISETGEVLDHDGICVCKETGAGMLYQEPALCAVGNNFWVFYINRADSPKEDVYGRMVTPEGTVGEPKFIGRSYSEPYSSTINCLDATYVENESIIVIWMRGSPKGIYCSIVSPSGELLLDSEALILTDDLDYILSVTASNSLALIVYNNPYSCDLWARRIDGDGNLLDTETIRIGTVCTTVRELSIDVIPYQDGWLIAYDYGSKNGNLCVKSITADGSVSDELFSIENPICYFGKRTSINIAKISGGFKLAWSLTCPYTYSKSYTHTQYAIIYNLDHNFQLISQDVIDDQYTGDQLRLSVNGSGTLVAVWSRGMNVGVDDFERRELLGNVTIPDPDIWNPVDSMEFNGNGTSDTAILRRKIGLWAVRNATRLYFGELDDIPSVGDYDGDRITDIAIFRKSSGLWAIRGITRLYFGNSTDTAVPSDYNGDGSCDIGIFRDISGLWAVRGITRAYFGTTNDQPVPGDYDGDGTNDMAIFRRSSGLWALRNVSRIYFGSYLFPDKVDTLVSGDYNGDGTSEPGIFRSYCGLWAIRGITRCYFGKYPDVPRPANINGDRSTDITIFKPASGLWASRNITRYYYGTCGDIPISGPALITPLPTRPSPTPQPTPTPEPTPREITIGTDYHSWSCPLCTYYKTGRTQVIYSSNEIGDSYQFSSLALDVTTCPGIEMHNFTIRMKHTSWEYFSSPEWEGGSWTMVYQNDESITSTGWHYFVFSTPFDYDGVNNLMIDFSFNNPHPSASGGCCRYSTLSSEDQSVVCCTDHNYGDPLTWTGDYPESWGTNYVPNIKLVLE